ncbi:hypothetical protein GQ44DRAFT_622168 [Phaeosphaeriaceae sp. PMI808]|nr:hypothetical protein GQ44DRAFT_622168 [Phaeosphaeriaceae sp. PMI808]
MLRTSRDERPTATEAKDSLAAIAERLFQPKEACCRVCMEPFETRSQLMKHLKKTGHNRKLVVQDPAQEANACCRVFCEERGLAIRGCANAPAQYHFDEQDLDAVDPSPCVVCNRYFDTKGQFFGHLGGVHHHWRNAKYVMKRKAAKDVEVEKEDQRLAKLGRHTIQTS